MKKGYFSCFLFLLFPGILFAAPTDFDSDGISDPSTVVAKNTLRWRSILGNNDVQVVRFGSLGEHLASASYNGQGTQPATIDQDGNWKLSIGSNTESFSFGADAALYLAGADFNGDGLADAAYTNNSCKSKRSKAFILLDPLGAKTQKTIRKFGKGYDFKTFLDADGDGKDDLCLTTPNKSNDKLTGTYQVKCKNVLNKKRVARFNAGRIYNLPLALRNSSGNDFLLLHRKTKGKTKLKILNVNGSTVKTTKIALQGTVLVGNYIAGNTQQVVVVGDDQAIMYDLNTNKKQSIKFPNGIPYDDININHFEDNEECFCSTKTIRKNKGSCKSGPVGNGACEVDRAISDGGGNWLHKPVSENTGSVVTLLNPDDHPADCRYENKNGKLYQDAFLAGFSNPNRPTWRPVSGGSCRNFPKPLVFACQIRGEKHCWKVPKPCTRYD